MSGQRSLKARSLFESAIFEDLDATELSLTLDLSVLEHELEYVLTLDQCLLKENVIMPSIYTDVVLRCPPQIGAVQVYHKVVRVRYPRQRELDEVTSVRPRRRERN